MCAPERIEMPTASASSWIAVSTICSGVSVEPGVDDLHPGVAKRAGDDLGAAIVPIEARLGDDDADLPCHGPQLTVALAATPGVSRHVPHTSRNASHISPIVT